MAAFERESGTKLFSATRVRQEVSRSGRELLENAERMDQSDATRGGHRVALVTF